MLSTDTPTVTAPTHATAMILTHRCLALGPSIDSHSDCLVLTHRCLAATTSAQAKHVAGNLLKEQLFGQLCFSSLLFLALDPSIELPIERAFAHPCCVTVPLLIEFITYSWAVSLASVVFWQGFEIVRFPKRSTRIRTVSYPWWSFSSP